MAGMTITPKILGFTRGSINPQFLDIIEIAGRTCYKSDGKIGDGTAEKFIRGIIARGHESVIEHSWFVLFIRDSDGPQVIEWLLNLKMEGGKLTSLTRRTDYFILSGNARMFRDYLRSVKGKFNGRDVAMLRQLQGVAPILFNDIESNNPETEPMGVKLVENSSGINFTQKEALAHFWAAVKITGGSRAFTHQGVRHRLMAISQESQRYCDEAGIYTNNYFVVPPSIVAAGQEQNYLDHIKQIDEWYQELIAAVQSTGSGKAREDARFLLPNACCSEIVISCNLEEWRQIFKMRCDSHAQWEIRQAMMELLPQFQDIFPNCFDDFIISEDGKSANISITN